MSAVIQETPKDAARRLSASAIREGFLLAGLHEYQDADGNPAFWRIRCKHPDGRKWIRPMRWNGAEYVVGEPPASPPGKPLYRLPELLSADPSKLVWIVEGETCANSLAKRGLIATTSGSADSADAADWTPLQGRSVRIWPDHDEPGRKYADKVRGHLEALGCAVSVVDLAPLGLPDKGDIVDWLKAHPGATGTDVEALAADLTPDADDGLDHAQHQSGDSLPRVVLVRGDTVMPRAVSWLWKGWLAAGKLHIIGGQPGTGKTTIALALAATTTIGGRWPDGSRAERGSVVIWSGEDDDDDTMNPRLRAAGADMRRVHVVRGMVEGGGRYPFDPARDMDALQRALADIPDVRLLVIDPVVSAVSGDSHKNAEVRRGLQPLVDLAQQHRCALLGVTHFTKGTAGREPVERITGSLAFGALARLVLVTAKTEGKDDEPARRFLARAKSNIGPDGGGFVYDLQQGELPGFPGIEASSVLWGAALEGTARELLADAESQDDEATRDSAGFLRELLRYGSRSAREIFTEAGNAGFSKDAMHRAKRKIGAVAVKQGMSEGWVWRLPIDEGGAEGSEGGAQIYPPPSPPSEARPPSSGGNELPARHGLPVHEGSASLPEGCEGSGQSCSQPSPSSDASCWEAEA